MEQIANGQLLTCPMSESTFLRAIPRDPDCIFACWEIAPQKIKELEKLVGAQAFKSCRRVLRVIDVTDIVFNGANAWQILDVTIDDSERKKYLRVPEAGRTYVVHYGIMTPENSFFSAIESNACAMPRKGVSDRMDGAWARINSAELLRLSTDALKNGGVEGDRLNGAGMTPGDSGSGGIF
jgi:hypothetical protein